MKVVGLRAEHHREPLGIGNPAPRLSWQIEGEPQVAYEIAVDGVTSGRVESTEQVLVPWPAAPLTSRQVAQVRVRAWARGADEPSPWSEPLTVEAGLLQPGDWLAKLIAADVALPEDADGPAVLLRREFTLPSPAVAARVYASAHGVYELELNGRRVGDHVLAPGWTSYHHRLRYQTFDVTELLAPGANTVSGWLADGWYRGRLGFGAGRRSVYGRQTALLVQLEIRCENGETVVVASDERWQGAPSPIIATGLYDGERYDARREPAERTPAIVLGRPEHLVAPDGPPVRRIQVLEPASASTTENKTIVDFGQNLTGRLRIRANGNAGDVVRLRHAEVLQDGELCVRPLRAAAALDEYTLKGGGIEEWEPRFTIHGFRYAEVTGPVQDVVAVVIHTDMARTGWFECSEPMLNKLHENVVWSMRGNFVDVPTDCPQRDERLGWTGDLAVFAPTATFLYDSAGPLTSWLADLAAEQRELGTVPFYVPWIELMFPARPAAVWGDVAVVAPWVLYERYGDLGLLRTQYASMRAWVDQIAALAGERHLWDSGFQFGDWLDPAAPPDRPAEARTDPSLVATAAHARSARLLARIAALLGEEDDHRKYAALATAITSAFNDEYVTPNGRLVSDAQTAYALALTADLLDKAEQRERAGRRLTELVEDGGYRVGTGFVGTPLLGDALTAVDAVDTAYRLLLQRECPSWLYPVTMGATTIWERWDSLLPDGTVNPGEMTSFNHYAFGAVADWLHRTVAGLAPADPGYRRIAVRPRPGGGLTHASATHDSPYGRIQVAWQLVGGRMEVDVTVPPGVTALVQLPTATFTPVEVGAGQHRFTASEVLPCSESA